jgi:hypothetical protein
MQVWGMRITCRDALFLLCAGAFAIAAMPSPAQASPGGAGRAKPAIAQPAASAVSAKPVTSRKGLAPAPVRRASVGPGGGFLQCVTFARDVSGIHLSGNAHTWWHAAAGRFARGQRPEVGAVLNFRASGGMRLGHVSVVSRVVSAREILVDDANWAAPGQRKGMVRRGASVIDVSPANDWSEVRVANGIGSWGRVYPTYGFIYPRADHGAEADRIEIAAARYTPAATPRPEPPTRGPAPAAGGWVWQGTTAVASGGAPDAARERVRPPAAETPRPAASTRWVWRDGQAVALD